MTDLSVYLALFGSAFAAATVLPGLSELGLAGLIGTGEYPVFWLVAIASIANTSGSVVNWLLGRGIERFRERRWFPASPAQIERASQWYHQFGRWSLLLSWMPVIGDPLTVVAGVLREPLPSFLLLVAIAKTARYMVVAGIALQWL